MSDVKCVHCGTWLSGETKICPNCNENPRRGFTTYLIIGLVGLVLFSGMKTCAESPTKEATPQNKLEETCKDWIYSRNKAFKLGEEGDQKGSVEASRAMKAFMADLEKEYSSQQISETIDRLEKSGYRTGL